MEADKFRENSDIIKAHHHYEGGDVAGFEAHKGE